VKSETQLKKELRLYRYQEFQLMQELKQTVKLLPNQSAVKKIKNLAEEMEKTQLKMEIIESSMC
jgi:hypothetical protein